MWVADIASFYNSKHVSTIYTILKEKWRNDVANEAQEDQNNFVLKDVGKLLLYS